MDARKKSLDYGVLVFGDPCADRRDGRPAILDGYIRQVIRLGRRAVEIRKDGDALSRLHVEQDFVDGRAALADARLEAPRGTNGGKILVAFP